jgi:hypothetical protein
MIISFLIIVVSVVLLVYWFRYSCILLCRGSQQQTANLPDDPRFAFSRVQVQLKTSAELDPLHRSLDRDFQLLKYLVEHAAGLRFESVEDRLLMIDYKVMRGWYGFTRLVAPEKARAALAERAMVLGILVRHMCERAGVTVET